MPAQAPAATTATTAMTIPAIAPPERPFLLLGSSCGTFGFDEGSRSGFNEGSTLGFDDG